VGSGVTSLDYAVYIGHTLPNGQVDFARSRECSGLQVLDKAGTRWKCPAMWIDAIKSYDDN
jgi:hypothetical protein